MHVRVPSQIAIIKPLNTHSFTYWSFKGKQICNKFTVDNLSSEQASVSQTLQLKFPSFSNEFSQVMVPYLPHKNFKHLIKEQGKSWVQKIYKRGNLKTCKNLPKIWENVSTLRLFNIFGVSQIGCIRYITFVDFGNYSQLLEIYTWFLGRVHHFGWAFKHLKSQTNKKKWWQDYD